MSVAALTLPAFAKINWTLRVLGRRADGYHELRTIFQTISLQDSLIFHEEANGELRLTCDSPDIPVDESNLILRAAHALRDLYAVKKGAHVHLTKKIPAAGGLGGGSSDAAIALVGLAHLWQIEISRNKLSEIGARIGADVPFFFTGGTALGTGLGTEVSPLTGAYAEHLLVVTPDVKVSTAEAYKALNAPALTKQLGDIILSISRADEQFHDSLHEALHNDFEPVVFRLYPEIERVKKALLAQGARGALLAGSGSSVFGIFDNREAQQQAHDALKAETGWRVNACASVARTEYLKALGPCAELLDALY
ncbi:MAG: 4-(cytidine 5'-diphospho)-2-C-methyl-D-erythritol kinase [Pyrinomonadaceae bacterium]